MAGLALPALLLADAEQARKNAKEVLADFHKREDFTYVMTERSLALARDEGKTLPVRLLAGVNYLAIAAGDDNVTGMALQVYFEDDAKVMTRVGELKLDEMVRKALVLKPQVAGKYYVFIKNKGGAADFQLYLVSQKPAP